MLHHTKAILFDLDNTILDRTQTFRSFSEKFVQTYFSGHTDSRRQEMIEQVMVLDEDGYKNKNMLFAELLEAFTWETKPAHEELMHFYSREYVNNAMLMADAIELLAACRNKYKVGLITNGQTAIQYGKIDKLAIRDYFDTILVSEEARVKKPDPRIFEMALERLNVLPHECVYVGDHPVNDIAGAGNTGMQTIWMKVNQPWRDDIEVQPLRTITTLKELIAEVAR